MLLVIPFYKKQTKNIYIAWCKKKQFLQRAFLFWIPNKVFTHPALYQCRRSDAYGTLQTLKKIKNKRGDIFSNQWFQVTMTDCDVAESKVQ